MKAEDIKFEIIMTPEGQVMMYDKKSVDDFIAQQERKIMELEEKVDSVSNTSEGHCPCGGKLISTNITGDVQCEFCEREY